MVQEADVTYKLAPGCKLELWAICQSTKADIISWAESFLDDLREEYPKAQVYINGRRVKPKRRKRDEGEETWEPEEHMGSESTAKTN